MAVIVPCLIGLPDVQLCTWYRGATVTCMICGTDKAGNMKPIKLCFQDGALSTAWGCHTVGNTMLITHNGRLSSRGRWHMELIERSRHVSRGRCATLLLLRASNTCQQDAKKQ